jgi:hypothetical protein
MIDAKIQFMMSRLRVSFPNLYIDIGTKVYTADQRLETSEDLIGYIRQRNAPFNVHGGMVVIYGTL